jgi:hypothetical protein
MTTEDTGEVSTRIAFAFRAVLARPPDTAELAALLRTFERTRELYRGEKPGGDDAELAAWTTVARTILNLDEVVTRE